MVKAIEVKDLTRLFGGRKTEPSVALDHLDLQVEEGELFGLLGPNGAGKTTLIKILSTLLLPSSGSAKVLGYDVVSEAAKIRPRINMVSGGETSGYGLLTVRENLWMFSQFYGIPGKEAKAAIEDLLAKFDLLDKGDSKVRTISTGQRQKMNVVRGFVTDPDLLYLDEPTLGLDVNASLVIREHLRSWVKGGAGKTLLLHHSLHDRGGRAVRPGSDNRQRPDPGLRFSPEPEENDIEEHHVQHRDHAVR